MNRLSVSQFRNNISHFLRRLAKGERFMLIYRGKPAARLESVANLDGNVSKDDPFLNIANRAKRNARGITDHRNIDRILYHRPS